MLSRRAFLRTTGGIGTAALAMKTYGLEEIAAATAAVAGQTPADAAKDEAYWGQIQQAFALDRTLINLNTGHHCSHPRVVADAVKRYLDMENQAPVYYLNLMRGHRGEPSAAASPPSSGVRRKSWRSRATPASRCRSSRTGSTSRPATKSSRPIRTTRAC